MYLPSIANKKKVNNDHLIADFILLYTQTGDKGVKPNEYVTNE